MPSPNDLKNLARAKARDTCARSQSFQALEFSEQKSMFEQVYQDEYNKLAAEQGLSPNSQAAYSGGLALSNGGGELAEGLAAGDLIDDQRHLNRRIDQAGSILGGAIADVNFPQFVGDLLQGVFDANLGVTVKQMQAYTQMLQEASKTLTHFVRGVSDDDAFLYLADQFPGQFNVSFGGRGRRRRRRARLGAGGAGGAAGGAAAAGGAGDAAAAGGTETGNVTLTNSAGKPVNMNSDDIRAKIVDAKLAMARERRALLRETVLMGITRLVVEKGTIKANVSFAIRADEEIAKYDEAEEHAQRIKRERSAVAGWWGFGGGYYSRSSERRTNQITVSSVDSIASSELTGQMSGSVEIQFKSDYFKLDNFARLLGGNVASLNQNAATPPAAAPPQALPEG